MQLVTLVSTYLNDLIYKLSNPVSFIAYLCITSMIAWGLHFVYIRLIWYTQGELLSLIGLLL